ncbi:hypothetical protein [Oceaniovalibus sp. ACAM 378]|uniref:hypothetical protein n=1 Tax=Oceaniovalibus sp. ACAM 378 TaxID=2599923 RepID=UPI0011D30C53|nr:hypothetical protein [Oceaniovalibus sp. ACAM 378]TYB84081.1 hypothetical protein FQ320_22900 [Oceaniovalibus sp. ACAM 378]
MPLTAANAPLRTPSSLSDTGSLNEIAADLMGAPALAALGRVVDTHSVLTFADGSTLTANNLTHLTQLFDDVVFI